MMVWAKNGSLVLLKPWTTVIAPAEVSKKKSWTVCSSEPKLAPKRPLGSRRSQRRRHSPQAGIGWCR